MEENETSTGRRLSWPIIAGFVVVIALILVGLSLPPISLFSRLGLGGAQTSAETPQATSGPAAGLPEGVALTADGVDVSRVAAAELATAAGDTLADVAGALPAGEIVSDAYILDFSGDAPVGQITLPLPAGLSDTGTVDLYGWDGEHWAHVPGQIDGANSQVVSAGGPLSRVLVLVRPGAPDAPVLAAEYAPGVEVPGDVNTLLGEVSVGALVLGENGSLAGDIAEVPDDVAAETRFLRVTNRGAVIDQAAISDLLNETAIQVMKEAGVDLTKQSSKGLSDFAGVRWDYVITMGCGDACPIFPGKRYEDWVLDDPAGMTLDSVRTVRDEIRQRVLDLMASLGIEPING